MYHEILPPCTHAQKEITCCNASLHPSEQFCMHKNTFASVLIVWELIEVTEYCQLLKKGSENALEVRRCTTKFSHLSHMRRRRSPVAMQVYIPVNSSICIRTLPQVYSSCMRAKVGELTVVHLSAASKGLWECSGSSWQMYSVNEIQLSHLAIHFFKRSYADRPLPMQVYTPSGTGDLLMRM